MTFSRWLKFNLHMKELREFGKNASQQRKK